MKKAYVLLLIILVLVMASTLVISAFLPEKTDGSSRQFSDSPISAEAALSITVGMTAKEVYSLLGYPHAAFHEVFLNHYPMQSMLGGFVWYIYYCSSEPNMIGFLFALNKDGELPIVTQIRTDFITTVGIDDMDTIKTDIDLLCGSDASEYAAAPGNFVQAETALNITAGMTAQEVVSLLGYPKEEVMYYPITSASGEASEAISSLLYIYYLDDYPSYVGLRFSELSNGSMPVVEEIVTSVFFTRIDENQSSIQNGFDHLMGVIPLKELPSYEPPAQTSDPASDPSYRSPMGWTSPRPVESRPIE